MHGWLWPEAVPPRLDLRFALPCSEARHDRPGPVSSRVTDRSLAPEVQWRWRGPRTGQFHQRHDPSPKLGSVSVGLSIERNLQLQLAPPCKVIARFAYIDLHPEAVSNLETGYLYE
jgi:hypothetical protein